MPVRDQYLAYVLEQLAGIGALRSNRMFGGIGLYSRDVFFGLIDDDTLFFKTDEVNVAPYVARRMPRFMPFPDRPEAVLGYHQVPADVIEDAEQLVEWARGAVDAAVRRRVAREARKRTSRPRRVTPRVEAATPRRAKSTRAKAKRAKVTRAKPGRTKRAPPRGGGPRR